MSINPELYTLPELEEPVEAEIIYQDVPAFSSPLETEREWQPYVPMQPEMMYLEALPQEPIFETPTMPSEPAKTEVKPQIKTEIVERFTEVPVYVTREIGFFAVLLAILFGTPLDTQQEEMV